MAVPALSAILNETQWYSAPQLARLFGCEIFTIEPQLGPTCTGADVLRQVALGTISTSGITEATLAAFQAVTPGNP
jgi:hypothetical protein